MNIKHHLWTQDICGDSNGVKKACRQIERGV